MAVKNNIAALKKAEASSRMTAKRKSRTSSNAALREQRKASLFGGANKWSIDFKESLSAMAALG